MAVNGLIVNTPGVRRAVFQYGNISPLVDNPAKEGDDGLMNLLGNSTAPSTLRDVVS